MPQINGYLGRIVKTPELKQTQTGKEICRFTLANDEGWGSSKKCDYIPCQAWEKTAQMISSHFQKGDPIIVEGRWSNNPYQKNERGYDIPNWGYTVNRVVFLPKPKPRAMDEDEDYVPDVTPQYQPAQSQPAQQSGGYAYSTGASVDDFAVIDDSESLPF